MRQRIFPWLGREFIELSGEGKSGRAASDQTRDIFARFDQELRGSGLSLDNTVRTRLWGRDRSSRDQGSTERVKILSGKARSASSSFISPIHFDSGAQVAVDLLAMRPSRSDRQKHLKEYEPPITPLRYLVYDSIVFLSGVTAVLPTLQDQMGDILPRIEASLKDAGSSWERAVKVSFLLHRSQKFESLRELFQERVGADIPRTDYFHVDGYSSEGKLIEIEVTARL
ncbi:MAG TPA: RidA family protein [Candidatus Binatia bacterium]|nr:RidA family protein [Candidatus Binatia bacterium]